MAACKYIFETHIQPGRYWTEEEVDRARCELRRVGEVSLPSVPNYQCFSDSPSAFDDKVLVIAREDGPTSRIVGFVSTVLLTVDGFGTVLHTGLTCVIPEMRRQSLQFTLFTRLLILLSTEYPTGLWITSLTCSPCSLVAIAQVASNVFPSPDVERPQDAHKHIAQTVSLQYRKEIDIAEDAVFDSELFLFKGNAPPGSPWYKDPSDPTYHHRNVAVNDYYVSLLSRAPGSEVLQVGFVDSSILQAPIRMGSKWSSKQ